MTASADLAALWFGYTVGVERLSGSGAYGPVFAASADVSAMIDPGNKMVRNASGDQVVSSARVFVPIGTAAIPDGSRVSLPATFGGRSATVISSLPHASGLGTPDHLELVLE